MGAFFSKIVSLFTSIFLVASPALEVPPNSSDVPDFLDPVPQFEFIMPRPVDEPPERAEAHASGQGIAQEIERGGGEEQTSLPYQKQCVYYARQNSPFQPNTVVSAKDVPALIFEPKPGAWSVYGAGCQYGKDGHNGVVGLYDLGTGWFEECGRNLYGEGNDYCRVVRFKGEGKDQCLKGFFWHDKL